MSQDPCNQETQEAAQARQASRSNLDGAPNPRQAVIEQLRARVEEYNLDAVYTADPPPPPPPPETGTGGDAGDAGDTGDAGTYGMGDTLTGDRGLTDQLTSTGELARPYPEPEVDLGGLEIKASRFAAQGNWYEDKTENPFIGSSEIHFVYVPSTSTQKLIDEDPTNRKDLIFANSVVGEEIRSYSYFGNQTVFSKFNKLTYRTDFDERGFTRGLAEDYAMQALGKRVGRLGDNLAWYYRTKAIMPGEATYGEDAFGNMGIGSDTRGRRHAVPQTTLYSENHGGNFRDEGHIAPLNSFGPNVQFDSFRYITGKMYAIYDDEYPRVVEAQRGSNDSTYVPDFAEYRYIPHGVHFLNTEKGPEGFKLNGWGKATMGLGGWGSHVHPWEARVRKVKDLSGFIEQAGGPAHDHWGKSTEFTKADNFREAMREFPGGKLENYEIACQYDPDMYEGGSFQDYDNLYNSQHINSFLGLGNGSIDVDIKSDAWFMHNWTQQWTSGYMRAGWSWKNYFHGFAPIPLWTYNTIKEYRRHFGAPEHIYIEDGNGGTMIYHPTDRERFTQLYLGNAYKIGVGGRHRYPALNSFANISAFIEAILHGCQYRYGASTGAPNYTFEHGRTYYSGQRYTHGHEVRERMPIYSTNMFPVIQFYGKETLDPAEIDNADDLFRFWGNDFVSVLRQKYGLTSVNDGYRLTNTINNFYNRRPPAIQDDTDDLALDYIRYMGCPNTTDDPFSLIFFQGDTFQRCLMDLMPLTSRHIKFGTVERKTFTDHATNIPAFTKTDDVETAKQKLSSFLHIKGEYNFFDSVYESYIDDTEDFFATSGYSNFDIINDNQIRSLVLSNKPNSLPNPYISATNRQQFDNLQEFDNIASQTENADELLRHPQVVYQFFHEQTQRDAEIAQEIYKQTDLRSEKFRDTYKKRKTFPMYTDMVFKQNGKSMFLDLVQGIDGSGLLLQAISQESPQNFETSDVGSVNNGGNLNIAKSLNVKQLPTRDRNEQEAGTIHNAGGERIGSGHYSLRVNPVKLERKEIKYIKLDDWTESVASALLSPNELSAEQRIMNAVKFTAFKQGIEKYAKSNYRSYDQIMNGELALSEVIGLKIRKYRLEAPQYNAAISNEAAGASFTQETLVKEFYFAGTNEDELTKYIDTQVEYGHSYRYEVYTVCIIIGTEYAYLDTSNFVNDMEFNAQGSVYSPYKQFGDTAEPGTKQRQFAQWYNRVPLEGAYSVTLDQNPTTPGAGNVGNFGKPTMRFSVISKPNVIIAEVHVTDRIVAILDKPPLPPNVDVVPQFMAGERNNEKSDVAGRVAFNINGMTGEMFAKPIVLESNDITQYSISALNQGLDPQKVLGPNLGYENYWGEPPAEMELLHFKNDDLPSAFEVYRTLSPPRSYADFANKKQAILQNGATSNTFYDQIIGTAWYTFRTIDVHGHTSLPGNVYQVSMKRDRSKQYVDIKLWEFPEPEGETGNKLEFERLLSFKPSLIQTELPDLANLDYNSQRWAETGYRLGTSTNPIWGKTILFKIKSKATGKMVEVRVKFNRKHGIVDSDGTVDYK